MKIVETMCHSHLLWMLAHAERFEKAVTNYAATTPAFQYEGVAGYVETIVTFEVRELEDFTALFMEYRKLSHEHRSTIYHNMLRGYK